MSRPFVLGVLLLSALLPRGAQAEVPAMRRFALLIGTNDGGADRARLRYAVSDAESFGEVLMELGGLDAPDATLLKEAGREDVQKGLAELRRKLERARAQGARTEAIIYYSGHSDEDGLLLHNERVSFSEFRAAIQSLPADVRVAILDSCASGALSRSKGGARRPAFLLDTSNSVRGQAILTSSAADEPSQESDRIGASYFTHHLVSGLRGAADSSHDGRVTLNEAYAFAFRETLARTERSQGGAQHPGYDMDLAGSGDLVLTDLRVTRAGLRIGQEVDGRLFVRDAGERLVLELRKSAGEEMEVGLAEGTYSVVREQGDGRWLAKVKVTSGGRAMVAGGDFSSIAREPTARRGGGGGGAEARFFNVGLAPYVSTNDVVAPRVSNALSVGLPATHAASVHGFALGAALHWTDGDATGAQLSGALNFAGGNTDGVQMAGGVNIGAGTTEGVQLAGGLNYAGEMRGFQASAVNVAGIGVGGQLGVVNIGGDVQGAQIGVVNIGSKVRGLQLGVLNLGGDVEGASVGVLSLVKNGQLHAEVWGSDVTYANVGIKLGSRRVYTVLAAGFLDGGKQDRWTAGLGLGVHFPMEGWFFDVDAIQHNRFEGVKFNPRPGVAQLRVLPGVQLAKGLAVIGGPTANVDWDPEDGPVHVWPGFQLGIRI